jgi:hypothetical protein
MNLVPPDHLTNEDLAIRQTLSEHPDLARRMTLLINRYRELVRTCLDDPEPADALKTLSKCESEMARLGIAILDSPEEWKTLRHRLP